MKLSKALRLAIKALEVQQKPLHFDANMHDQQGLDYPLRTPVGVPLAVSASKQRQTLREAAALLTDQLETLKGKEP
jgi:hypothetical protein